MSRASSAIQRFLISWRRRSFRTSSATARRIARCASGLPVAARARRPILSPCSSASRSPSRSATSSCRFSPRMSTPDAVAHAREGLYAETIEAEVSPARLARFFSKEDHGYRVSPDLRAAVVFTVQDVLADPPFSRLDLISCRNLLIYLRPEAQAKVLSLFDFALREGGILLLGSTETVGNFDGRFEVISKPERLYRHIGHWPAGRVWLFNGRRGWRARSPAPRTRPWAIAPGCSRRPLPAAGDGELCAGRGADQPQARVSLFFRTDRSLSARGARAPDT